MTKQFYLKIENIPLTMEKIRITKTFKIKPTGVINFDRIYGYFVL